MLSGLTFWKHKTEKADVVWFSWLLVGSSETVDMHGSVSLSVRTYLSPSSHGHPRVFFGVSNYHSQRRDRRQIFNRQAITAVNTVCRSAFYKSRALSPRTQELYLHSETGLEPPQAVTLIAALSSAFDPLYVTTLLSDSGQIFVTLWLLIPGHYATSICLPTKFAHKKSKPFNTYQILSRAFISI